MCCDRRVHGATRDHLLSWNKKRLLHEKTYARVMNVVHRYERELSAGYHGTERHWGEVPGLTERQN